MKTALDTKTMSPDHEFNKLMSNARSLKVVAGRRTYEGEAMLEDANGDGHLVLTFKAQKKAKSW